ncbi:DUF1642 domain-containing protein [uncultured Enterococcus sp.]|uniref:DUF1642 domain-containing protein n=1 Tax=uncultured Enterococcus sp. TaxID=167972 RepID=UPI002AA89973|nr:DUF1642 domain-containing protein [uncultured Enterococcus sp.]
MSKVEEKIKKNKFIVERNEQAIKNGMSLVGKTDLEMCIEMRLEFIDDLKEINAEQEELQKKADKYDELSKPVEIPQFVAEYLDERKEEYPVGGLGAAVTSALDGKESPEIRKWMNNNTEIFARAWLDGYTVQQEQLYYMPVLYQKNKTLYYCFDRNGEITFGQGNLKSDKYKFTKEQIEQHFPEITDRAIEAKEEQV